jgi:uncharacterized membrane protein YhaH (DUF805 family)
LNLFLDFWKNAFDFKGVIGRKDFFLTLLVTNVILFPLTFVPESISLLLALLLGLPSLAIQCRRLNDIGKARKNLLWLFLPILGFIYVIYLYFQPTGKYKNLEPVSAPIVGDLASQLRELASLMDDGMITKDEFAAKKKLILATT